MSQFEEKKVPCGAESGTGLSPSGPGATPVLLESTKLF